jgi:flagellar biosynthesis/type III secretory pathway M-ring protein FliF/YscJ
MQKAYGAPMKGQEDLLPTLESMVGSNSARFGEMVVLLGFIALLLVALLIWARFFRRRRRRPLSRRNLPNLEMRPAEDSRNGQSERRSGSGGLRRHRHRHRRRHHEQYTHRNPTLAETGGLPPPRDEPFGSSPS